jgi:hypothetical protein
VFGSLVVASRCRVEVCSVVVRVKQAVMLAYVSRSFSVAGVLTDSSQRPGVHCEFIWLMCISGVLHVQALCTRLCRR